MKRKLLCGLLATAAALCATGAMAADLPSSAPAPAPYIAPPPVFTWTGFYVGVNAGINFNGASPTFAPSGIPGGATGLAPAVASNAGFTGGGEAGYNWQVSQFVFGIEGDVDYLGRSNQNGTFVSPAFYGAGSTYTLAGGHNGSVYGTVRGRVGWAVDRALFFATGGVAFGGTGAPTTLVFSTGSAGCVGGGCVYTSNNNNNVGAVVGGGVEYAFTPNWTAKVEYLHTFYGNMVYTNAFAQKFTSNNGGYDNNLVRVGLNYKF